MSKELTHSPYRSNDLYIYLNRPSSRLDLASRSKLPKVVNFLERLLAIGNTFSFIIDFSQMQYLFVSESSMQVTGYRNTEWQDGGVEFAMDKYHPEDEPIAESIHKRKAAHIFSTPASDRCKFRYTHDFRIRHANGNYIRLNHHAVLLDLDEVGNPLSALCICNDITNLKSSTTLNFEVSKLNEKGQYVSVLKEYYPQNTIVRLSSREYEILKLLAEGAAVKDIAVELSISEHTVRDHRKNMLHKNNMKTTSALISKSWKAGVF